MKVIQFDEYGGPEVLKLIDKDIPKVKKHEVLIKVERIGVNFADTARREGEYVVPTELPFIPGSEVAGIVEKVGSEVENIIEGQSENHILKTMGKLSKGETVLVHSASGGVGLLAIQLAKLFGAGKVIATASTSEKRDLAKSMGADYLIDYTKDNWENELETITEGNGLDLALEMVGRSVFHKTRK